MAHTIRFHRQSQSEFSKQFSSLCSTRSAWEVWSDFVTISAAAVANSVDQVGANHDKREQEYLRLIKRYTAKEQDGLATLFAMMVQALEKEPTQDFLGEMFMAFELGNHWHGQFFTPYHICEFMARATLAEMDTAIQSKGWVGISDPCCGAGALLIGARNEMVRQGRGYDEALYVAQDIDRTAALMCYLQLSLLGCAGYVVVGNSLTDPVLSQTGSPLLIAPSPTQEVWIMPATCLGVWPSRIQWEWLRVTLSSLCTSDAPKEITTPSASEDVPLLIDSAGGQLALF